VLHNLDLIERYDREFLGKNLKGEEISLLNSGNTREASVQQYGGRLTGKRLQWAVSLRVGMTSCFIRSRSDRTLYGMWSQEARASRVFQQHRMFRHNPRGKER